MTGPRHTNGHPALPLSNDDVAAALEEVGHLLARQNANVFRVQAYHTAARTIRALERPVAALLETEGLGGLQVLPGVGVSLARSIEQLVRTGRLPLLSQLRGDSGPEALFTTVPGIGPRLAARIHEELGLESLQDLEIAAWDGRLATVSGMGRRRIQAIRESLAGRFRRRPPVSESAPRSTADDPPVAELLDIDSEYRRKAGADRLLRIAPRRFNPSGEAWLPILHTHRGERHYTALYSNTARAHELGTTRDWVVIYRDDHAGRGQWTVVTSQFGPLRGQRIVRGREAECRALAQSPERDVTPSGRS